MSKIQAQVGEAISIRITLDDLILSIKGEITTTDENFTTVEIQNGKIEFHTRILSRSLDGDWEVVIRQTQLLQAIIHDFGSRKNSTKVPTFLFGGVSGEEHKFVKDEAKEQIQKRVIEIVSSICGINEKNIKDSTYLSELHTDSLDVVEIVMMIEEEFEIVITDKEIDEFPIKLKTIQDIVNHIQLRQKEKGLKK